MPEDVAYTSGFNPSCIGFGLGGAFGVEEKSPTYCVSILLVLDLAWEVVSTAIVLVANYICNFNFPCILVFHHVKDLVFTLFFYFSVQVIYWFPFGYLRFRQTLR